MDPNDITRPKTEKTVGKKMGESAASEDFLPNLRLRASSVVGVLDLLILSGLKPKQLKYAEMARASGKELLAMLENANELAQQEGDSRVEDKTLDASVPRRTRLVELFLEHIPSYIAALAAAIERRDAKEVEERAHKIKGSCLAFGAPRMSELCLNIEMSGRNCSLEQTPQALLQLEEEFEKVRRLLDTELHKDCTPSR